MGCHTWFYKRIKTPLKSEMIQAVNERIDKELEFLNRLVNDRESIDNDLLEAYPEWDNDFVINNIQYWEKEKRSINLDDEKLTFSYCEFSDELIDYDENGNFYIEIDDFHDVFRKYGYPETKLFSLEETLAYINDENNKCVVYDNTIERLTEFWEKYPNGMINFG